MKDGLFTNLTYLFTEINTLYLFQITKGKMSINKTT